MSEVKKHVEKLMSATDKVICEAKQEVAREIFEEIEKLKHTKWDWNDYVDWDAIANLKKKYTGE